MNIILVVKTRDWPSSWDESIGNLVTGWVATGVEEARDRFGLSCGTAGTSRLDVKGDVQVAETMRTRVPMQETGTEQLVVVLKWL